MIDESSPKCSLQGRNSGQNSITIRFTGMIKSGKTGMIEQQTAEPQNNEP